jgi:hypothetical protein
VNGDSYDEKHWISPPDGEASVRLSSVKPRLGFLGLGWIGLQRMAAIAASGEAEIVALVRTNNPTPGNFLSGQTMGWHYQSRGTGSESAFSSRLSTGANVSPSFA